MLRHIGETDATVWVEVDGPCEVEVLDHSAPSFQVGERHYAIVAIEGLEPGTSYEYEVRLDGKAVSPPDAERFPPSTIRTIDPERPLRLIFGSCRTAAPHRPPYTSTSARASDARGMDALRTCALRWAAAGPGAEADALMMLGDQLYADDTSPEVKEYARKRQVNPDAPATQLEDFDEYAFAYCDAWSSPAIRWLLSTVPSAMIFDDHEIHDEWKTSLSWVKEMRSKDWYERRVVDGLVAYWIYQHLGNLSPAELREDELLRRAHEAKDALPLLREFAAEADDQADRSRWSYCRDFGRTRLVVFDSRGSRQLEPGRREILTDEEWEWIEERASGSHDHLLLASSIPFLLAHGLHSFEAWNERLSDGAWGGLGARVGERIRRVANIDHWAGFQRSFHRFTAMLERLAAGAGGEAPGSIVLLSGDVHHCYLAEVAFPSGSEAKAPVWQAVCSGMRKQLATSERLAMQAGHSRPGRRLAEALAKSIGVDPPSIDWRITDGPVYDNQLGTLELERGGAAVKIESPEGSDWRRPELHTVIDRQLLEPAEGQ